MTSDEVKTKIQELDSLRSQARYWRLGITAFIALITVICVGILVNSVHNLYRSGPAQDEFTSALTTNLKRDTLPEVQTMATQALTDSKPEVQTAFAKLNSRVPELTSTSLQQLTMLQSELPARGDKVLNTTYGAMLKKHEAKIHTMFPDVTEANLSTMVDTMSAEGQQQIISANNALFSKHMAAMNAIQGDITKIQDTETVTPDEDQANWEMALVVVDDFHDELQSLQQSQNTSGAKSKTGKAVKK